MRIVDSFKNREVLKMVTPSALIIYMCSELNEEGKIIKVIAAKDVLDIGGVSRASYYRGVKELEKNNLISGAKAQNDNSAKGQKSTQIEKVSISNQKDNSIEGNQKDNTIQSNQNDSSIESYQKDNGIENYQKDNNIENYQKDNNSSSDKKSQIDNSIIVTQNEIETSRTQFDNGIKNTQFDDNRRESQTGTKKSAIDWESLLF